MDMQEQVLTVKERPQHHAIGRFFYGWDGQVFYCDSYDPRVDFYMTNVIDSNIRRAVSPRAIGRTFHSAGDITKPMSLSEAGALIYLAIDTRMSPASMAVREVTGESALGLHERIALFNYRGDATKFLAKVQSAAAELEAERAGA